MVKVWKVSADQDKASRLSFLGIQCCNGGQSNWKWEITFILFSLSFTFGFSLDSINSILIPSFCKYPFLLHYTPSLSSLGFPSKFQGILFQGITWKPVAKKRGRVILLTSGFSNMLKDGLKLQEEQRKSYVKVHRFSDSLFLNGHLARLVFPSTLWELGMSTLGCQSAVCRKASGGPWEPESWFCRGDPWAGWSCCW